MNAKATELGLSGSRFEDPTGLSSANVATAWDLARIIEAAYHYPEIRDFTTRPQTILQSGRHSIQFPNTNALVRNPIGHRPFKTGYIEEAGRCLVMQAMLANRPCWSSCWILGSTPVWATPSRIKQWMEARLGPK